MNLKPRQGPGNYAWAFSRPAFSEEAGTLKDCLHGWDVPARHRAHQKFQDVRPPIKEIRFLDHPLGGTQVESLWAVAN